MGTNYYAKLGICVNCKKATEEYHIGKNSGGWVFLFRKQPFWKNYKEVKAFLNKKEVSIWDEYGKKTPKKVFFELVDGTYADKKSKKHDFATYSIKDEEGREFWEVDFS